MFKMVFLTTNQFFVFTMDHPKNHMDDFLGYSMAPPENRKPQAMRSQNSEIPQALYVYLRFW